MIFKLIYYLFIKLNKKEQFFIVCTPIFTCISVVLTFLFPYILMQYAQASISLTFLLSFVFLYFSFLFLQKYVTLMSSNILFGLRLQEVGNLNVASLTIPQKSIDLENGRKMIYQAQEAVAYGNDQGIEIYFLSFIQIVSNFLIIAVVLILSIQVSIVFCFLFLLFIIAEIIFLFIMNKKIHLNQKQFFAYRFEEETLRNVCTSDAYVKEIRITQSQNIIYNLISTIQLKIYQFIDKKEKKRVLQVVILGLFRLFRVVILLSILLTTSPSLLILWISILLQLNNYLEQLATSFFTLFENKAFTKSLFDFYAELKNKKQNKLDRNNSDMAIIFEEVSFSYPNKNLFSNISFQIKKGEKIAVIGENGVGKSTLIRLLANIYEPQAGKISYGYSSQKTNLFSLAFQDSHFFAFSLLENIIGCKRNDEEKLERLLNYFDVNNVVKNTKYGLHTAYSTQLEKEGVEFSKGEKQSLALVRSAYKDSEILFFDEPSASFDVIKEKKLYEKLANYFNDKTLIFTTHRYGSTHFCDRILFIKNSGEIILDTFQNLYATQIEFRKLYDLQIRAYHEEEK